MEFEWDEVKATTNLYKHGIDFADASDVFYDVFAVAVREDYPFEERFLTIGQDGMGRLLVVVFTFRE